MDYPAWLALPLAGIFGLMIGSFLNVVIYRLPKMMEQEWADQYAEYAGTVSEMGHEPFNLAVPRSACPNCGHLIHWYENVPVLSYAMLGGKCASCRKPISLRYPLVECASSLLFAWCAWRWGISLQALVWCGFSAALLSLSLIDWDTTLLPDSITLPLVWAGLIASALGLTFTPLMDSLWGATAGYLSLWLIYWGFKLLTGKEGMGYGDFKLFAALGAWFGWTALVPIILIASLVGAVLGLIFKATSRLQENGAMPFGPFLALGGLITMVAGPTRLLRLAGLI